MPACPSLALAYELAERPALTGRPAALADETRTRVAAYTSEVFYEGRLHSHPGRECLAVAGESTFSGAGIRFLAVPREGHSSESPEEAAAIAELVRRLLASGAKWTDAEGAPHPLIVVALRPQLLRL